MAVTLSVDAVTAHLDTLVPPRHAELQRMEAWAAEHDFPIIGPASGHCCYLLARIAKAQRVFELGSGYGYSTAWFARAVRENGGGEVHHAVWDEELSRRARAHLAALGLDDLVRYHVGEAVAALRADGGTYDLIFNDIDKAGYPASIAAIEQHLRPGGLLIMDNMIWSGRALDSADQSADTVGIREATRLLTSSPHWISTIVPIRDGLMVASRV
jgi:predicted O-methyltransferase YrrM